MKNTMSELNYDLVKNSDTPQIALQTLNRSYGVTWREIANLDQYNGIPPGFGWGVYPVVCPLCYRETVHVVLAMTVSDYVCKCGYRERRTWGGREGETPHDGGWLDPVRE